MHAHLHERRLFAGRRRQLRLVEPPHARALERPALERDALAQQLGRAGELRLGPVLVAGHAHQVLLLDRRRLADDVLHERRVVRPEQQAGRLGIEPAGALEAGHVARVAVAPPARAAAAVVALRQQVACEPRAAARVCCRREERVRLVLRHDHGVAADEPAQCRRHDARRGGRRRKRARRPRRRRHARRGQRAEARGRHRCLDYAPTTARAKTRHHELARSRSAARRP